jgi:hypothetical protein
MYTNAIDAQDQGAGPVALVDDLDGLEARARRCSPCEARPGWRSAVPRSVAMFAPAAGGSRHRGHPPTPQCRRVGGRFEPNGTKDWEEIASKTRWLY